MQNGFDVRMLPISILLAFRLAACGGVDAVRTQPPQPADYDSDSATAPPAAAQVTVAFRAGSALHQDVRALRFRLDGMTLHTAADTASAYRVGSAEIAVTPDPASRRRVLLQARMPPARYDTLSFRMRDTRVRFGPNAGGPLTTAGGGDTMRVPLSFSPAPGDSAQLRLRFDAAASLERSDDCRWRFAPAFAAEQP
jgi:hypothetical protein